MSNKYPPAANRKIRLKEWGLNMDLEKNITDEYVRSCDESINPGKVRLRTDQDGFILTGNELEAEGRKPILMIGGSFVESLFVDESERFASVAERSLEESHPGKYRILNAGYSGMSSLHLLEFLTAKIRPLFSELAGLVLFAPLTDQGIIGRPRSYWDQEATVMPIVPGAEGITFPSESFDGNQDIAILWELMIRFAKHYDVPTVVAASPFRRSDFDEDLWLQRMHSSDPGGSKRVIDFFDQLLDRPLAEARSLSTPVLDARKFASMKKPNHKYFYDRLHLNRAGHQAFGKDLAHHLMALRLFD